jgi:hypothetical protein
LIEQQPLSAFEDDMPPFSHAPVGPQCDAREVALTVVHEARDERWVAERLLDASGQG